MRWKAMALGLTTSALLVVSKDASSRESDDVQFRLQAGVCAIVSPKHYSDVAQFKGVPEILSVGATLKPRRFARGSLDLSFINLGVGSPSDVTAPDMVATVDPSTLVSAQMGIELQPPRPDGSGPYVSGALGVGRAFLGGVHVGSLPDPDAINYPGQRVTGPLVAAGAGLRTARILDGPRFQLEARWVTLFSSGRAVNIVPVTLGFLF